MKKTIFAIALCAVLLASCKGGTDTPAQTTDDSAPIPAPQTAAVEIDMNAFAADAVGRIEFDIDLEELSADAVGYLYPGLPEGTEGVIYSTGGAGAEEFAMFRTTDPAALLSAIDAHRESQRTAFASYKPDDVAKIDNAVTVQHGDYTVFCISADHEGTKKVIGEMFG